MIQGRPGGLFQSSSEGAVRIILASHHRHENNGGGELHNFSWLVSVLCVPFTALTLMAWQQKMSVKNLCQLSPRFSLKVIRNEFFDC